MYHLEDCPYWKGSLFSIASDNTVEVTSDDGPCPGCSRARQNKFEIRWPYIMQAVGTETQDSDLRVINSTSNPYVLRIVPAQGSISFEVDHYVANLTNIQEATERRLPQWGFRVVHKRSVGWNEEGEYFAHAVKGGLGESDFFDFSQRDIYEQLDCHERGVHFTSHFVSFTESIVEALIRARSAYRRGGEDVEIHMFDLTTLKQPALIGHALALLKGYLVFRDKNLVHRAKLKGASVTEFLVWDVLELDACVVRYKDLVRAGITEIVPALRSSCRNTLLPGQDTKRNPRRPTPSEVRNQLCRVELTLKQAERDAEANKGNPLWSFRNNRVGRFPIHTPKVFKEFEDPRSPMGMHTMNKYLQVARCARKPKFVLPWLVALLSLSTSIYTRESMIDLLDDILAADAIEYRGNLYERKLRSSGQDVVVMYDILTELHARMRKAGRIEGVAYPKPNLIRLDKKAAGQEYWRFFDKSYYGIPLPMASEASGKCIRENGEVDEDTGEGGSANQRS